MLRGRGRLIRGRDGSAFPVQMTRKSREKVLMWRGILRGGRNLCSEMYRGSCDLVDLTLCCTSIPSPQSFSSRSKFKVIQRMFVRDRFEIENPNSRLPALPISGFVNPNTFDLHFLVNSVFRERKLNATSQSTAFRASVSYGITRRILCSLLVSIHRLYPY